MEHHFFALFHKYTKKIVYNKINRVNLFTYSKNNIMKITLTVKEIARKLLEDENANWSAEGAMILAEHLNETCDENEEFDRVAICCYWSEYDSLQDWANRYFSNIYEELKSDEINPNDQEEIDEWILNYLNDNTTVLELDNDGVVVFNF